MITKVSGEMETNGESKDEEMPPLERTIDEDIAIVEG